MTTETLAEPYVEFDIDEGSTFSRILQLIDMLQLVIDLTGCSARMQFRRTLQSSIVLLEATNANSKLVVGTTDGNIQLNLLPADTALLKGDCVYDCKVTFPSGEVITAFSGKVSLNPAVTR